MIRLIISASISDIWNSLANAIQTPWSVDLPGGEGACTFMAWWVFDAILINILVSGTIGIAILKGLLLESPLKSSWPLIALSWLTGLVISLLPFSTHDYGVVRPFGYCALGGGPDPKTHRIWSLIVIVIPSILVCSFCVIVILVTMSKVFYRKVINPVPETQHSSDLFHFTTRLTFYMLVLLWATIPTCILSSFLNIADNPPKFNQPALYFITNIALCSLGFLHTIVFITDKRIMSAAEEALPDTFRTKASMDKSVSKSMS